MTKLTHLIKEILKEQIGGEIKSPNEFTYFDFKDWVWSDRKYYFREKTFKDNNNMTLAQAVEENLLEDIFQMLTTLWETFIEETEVPMHGKIKDENRLKFGEDLYEMMKEDNLLFKKDKINSSADPNWPRSFQLQEQTPDYITYPGGGGDFNTLELDACLDENGIYNCGITPNGNQTHCFICSETIPLGSTEGYWSGTAWQSNPNDVLCSQMTTNPNWSPSYYDPTPPIWSQPAVNHPSQCNTTWSPSCDLLDGQSDDQIQMVVDYCNDIPEAMWSTDQFAAMLCPCLTPQDIYNPQFQQADCNTFDTLPLDFQNTICQSCEDPNYVNMHCQCCDDSFTVGGSAIGGGDALSMPSTPSLTKTPMNKKVVNRLQKLAGLKK